MKKIINGIRYDQTKGIEIAKYTYKNPGDIYFIEEILYKSPRSDRFFIVGNGGPQTKFAVRTGINEWSSGSDLWPVDKDEALHWMSINKIEVNDLIDKYFFDMIEEA